MTNETGVQFVERPPSKCSSPGTVTSSGLLPLQIQERRSFRNRVPGGGTETIAQVLAPSTLLSRVRIPELDGIRGVAVLSVLAYHVFAFSQQLWAGRGTDWSGFGKALNLVTWPGFLGVDIFFVLSGFLITGILLDTKDDPSFLRNFYARRAARILPLYMVVMIVIAGTYSDSGKFLLLSVFFLSNLALLLGITPIGPYWSLAVEEHFYLIWPFVVKTVSRRTLLAIAAAIVVIEPALRIAGFQLWGDGYFYSWTRLDGLAWGALVACFARSHRATRETVSKLAWICSIAALMVLLAGLPFGLLSRKNLVGAGFQYLPAQLISASLILAALTRQCNIVTRLLGHGTMRLFGDLSYCLYMIHMLVMDGYDRLVHRIVPGFEPGLGPLGALTVRAVTVVTLSIGLALLSRRFLERPALQLSRYLQPRKVVNVPLVRVDKMVPERTETPLHTPLNVMTG